MQMNIYVFLLYVCVWVGGGQPEGVFELLNRGAQQVCACVFFSSPSPTRPRIISAPSGLRGVSGDQQGGRGKPEVEVCQVASTCSRSEESSLRWRLSGCSGVTTDPRTAVCTAGEAAAAASVQTRWSSEVTPAVSIQRSHRGQRVDADGRLRFQNTEQRRIKGPVFYRGVGGAAWVKQIKRSFHFVLVSVRTARVG